MTGWIIPQKGLSLNCTKVLEYNFKSYNPIHITALTSYDMSIVLADGLYTRR